MRRIVLRAKIHSASVTQADIDYEGSLTLDEELMEKAGVIPYEQVHVYNVSNGERFVTYLIKGERGSGTIGINGAAVHKANVGDRLILAFFGLVDEEETDFFIPKVLILDQNNRIKTIKQ